jgi:hypothetical protein
MVALMCMLGAMCAVVRHVYTPIVTVRSNVVDLGTVSIGDIYKVPFKLSNHGRRDVAIEFESTVCPIAHVEMPAEIGPGDSVNVVLHLRIRELIHTPKTRFDRIEMPCNIRTNDFAARQIKLTVVANRDNSTQPKADIDEPSDAHQALGRPL